MAYQKSRLTRLLGGVALSLAAYGCYAPQEQADRNERGIQQVGSRVNNIASTTSEAITQLRADYNRIRGLQGVEGLLQAESYLDSLRREILTLQTETRRLQATTNQNVGDPSKGTGIYALRPTIETHEQRLTNLDARHARDRTALEGRIQALETRLNNQDLSGDRNRELYKKVISPLSTLLRDDLYADLEAIRTAKTGTERTTESTSRLARYETDRTALHTLHRSVITAWAQNPEGFKNNDAWQTLLRNLESAYSTEGKTPEEKFTLSSQHITTYVRTVNPQ